MRAGTSRSPDPASLISAAGDQGVVGQGSFKANIGGIPSKSSHVMVPLTVTPSQADNLKNAWGFTLTVGKKTPPPKNGKIAYVASGKLHLPGGDTVQFADKPVKYTKHQGYTVTFEKGQNITLVPPAKDKKSTIAIKKLTLTQQPDDAWSPTGGRIVYQFMGQKGSGVSSVSFPRRERHKVVYGALRAP